MDGRDAVALRDTWVLITGASGGFGEQFARQFAEQGHSLVLVARRLDRLQALARELREHHGIEVIVEQVDLSDIAAVGQLHQRLRERGVAIDILINNAGHGLQGPFLDSPLDAALAMVQLDVASLTAVTHLFAQDMRKRGRGKILLVASLLAYSGVENFAVYAAAKAYVLRLAEALHRELKGDGITVTTINPGMSDTGFASTAGQKMTRWLKLFMMQPAPVVRAGIRALKAGRISIVPGWANKATVVLSWAASMGAPGHCFSCHERISNCPPERISTPMESIMILVRDVFQLKVGKAKEAKALFKEATEIGKKYDMPAGRALTDLTGTYYTFVWESTHKSLGDWEASMQDPRGAEEWGAWYQKFAPLIDGGHREIMTVVE